jgi:beta-lactam-binding protein with PASTA domain
MMQDLVGETLGDRYRLTLRLAGGGMGEVYRAHDLLLDRPVAVKVLQPSLATELELVERFKAEARAAARLSHPNVVAVYDWGSEDERTYYMVMEYVSGTDLRDVLVTRGSIEPAQATEIVASLCDALALAHGRGLVHRDVKPENVLIDRDGNVKVADFGIAVVVDVDPTSPGVVPGTWRYLAPEQAQGREASPASDIWAAGALLAELVTGHPPLQGAGTEFLRRRATEPPRRPSDVDGRVPAEIDEVVLRACAVDPADRFDDASDMAHALRRAEARALPAAPPLHVLHDELTGEIRLPEAAPQTRTARRRRSRRRLKIVALCLGLLALVGGGGIVVTDPLLPGTSTIPDLEGLSLEAARRRAAAAGLSVTVEGREHHFGAQPGDVVAQDPAFGATADGDTVRLTLSAGLPLTEVPSVIGEPVDEATSDLRVRGVEVGRITKTYSRRPEGRVIAQTPSRGRVRWGSMVDLVVSQGPKPVAVPALDRMPATRARRRLERAGFEVVTERAYSNDVRAGNVLATTPAAGQVIPGGSRVELLVSLGPEFAEVTMPDVRNLSVARARRVVERAGLRARVVTTCPGDTVVETDPVQGTIVRENDLVALFVC